MPGCRIWVWKLENSVIRLNLQKSLWPEHGEQDGEARPGQGHQARHHQRCCVNSAALWVAVACWDSRDVRSLGGFHSGKLGDWPEETGKAAQMILVSNSSGRMVVAHTDGIMIKK